MGYKLSLLDQSPIAEGMSVEQALAQTVSLAKVAEALGYYRFWVSEHHNSDELAGSSRGINHGCWRTRQRCASVPAG